jgi:hypothetical protein
VLLDKVVVVCVQIGVFSRRGEGLLDDLRDIGGEIGNFAD